MAVTLPMLMHSEVITKVISQIKSPMNRMHQFYGMGPGGRHTTQVEGRHFGWDIFNHTRKIAGLSAPATGPRNRRKIPIGTITSQAMRVHEKIHILHERLFRNRAPGAPVGSVDVMGRRYITKQEEELARAYSNTREWAVVNMFKSGKLYVKVEGDDHSFVRTSGAATFEVDFKHPAENRGAVTRPSGYGGPAGTTVFAGNWQDPTADIHGELLLLNDLSELNTGYPITDAWVTGYQWNNILKNNGVRELAGTANSPHARYERMDGSVDGIGDTGFVGVLAGIDWIRWHVYSGVLDVDGTTEMVLNPTEAIFTPEPESDWLEMMEGSEFIKENVMHGGRIARGMSAWATTVIDPAAEEIKMLDNFLPAPYIPKAWYTATVSA